MSARKTWLNICKPRHIVEGKEGGVADEGDHEGEEELVEHLHCGSTLGNDQSVSNNKEGGRASQGDLVEHLQPLANLRTLPFKRGHHEGQEDLGENLHGRAAHVHTTGKPVSFRARLEAHGRQQRERARHRPEASAPVLLTMQGSVIATTCSTPSGRPTRRAASWRRPPVW